MQKKNVEALETQGEAAAINGQTNKEKAFSSINTKSFLVVLILLTVILIGSGLLSLFVPQGSFDRDENGMVIAGTYVQGPIQGIAAWRVITAPFRVFASEDALTIIMISLFLLIMSGVFNLLNATDGISVIIGKTVRKFSEKKKLVVCLMVLVFMAFGSFFGMFEELVTLLPLVIVFMLSMGFDTLTGLGVCLLAACFGFSAAITNPFSVGIVAGLAEIHVLEGAWLRVIFFIFVLLSVCGFLLLHAKKIAKNPQSSLTYAIDREKLKNLDLSFKEETAQEKRIFKVYVIFFAVQLAMLVLIASIRAISGYAIPILAVSFLIGGIISGVCVCEKKGDVFKYIWKGAVAMLPAVVLIALATSVKLVMAESGILDTIMYIVINALQGKSEFLCVVLIYFLILFLQIFIGSSSAKIMLIMPIVLPMCATLGISPTTLMLTYCMADGFTDVILPTNPVLLIGLSIADVSYGKWVKWTWKFQLAMFAATILFLFFAVQIGY